VCNHGRKCGLTDPTIAILVDQGFVNKDALSVMELSDIGGLKVKQIAQKRLLERLLRREHAPLEDTAASCPAPAEDAEIATMSPKPGTSSMSASNLLDNLLKTADDSEAKTQGMGLNTMSAECDRGDLNPLVYLSDNSGANYLDIVDFVPRAIHREEENNVLSANGEFELMLKMGPKKPRLEEVSMMDWTAANARIMAKLLLEGKLATRHTAL
jgi:hypothetical protein